MAELVDARDLKSLIEIAYQIEFIAFYAKVFLQNNRRKPIEIDGTKRHLQNILEGL